MEAPLVLGQRVAGDLVHEPLQAGAPVLEAQWKRRRRGRRSRKRKWEEIEEEWEEIEEEEEEQHLYEALLVYPVVAAERHLALDGLAGQRRHHDLGGNIREKKSHYMQILVAVFNCLLAKYIWSGIWCVLSPCCPSPARSSATRSQSTWGYYLTTSSPPSSPPPPPPLPIL